MTNKKLPVVGCRYRNKNREEWTFANEEPRYFRFIGNLAQDSVLYIRKHLMWQVFEEILETKEVEEDCPAEQAAEEWNTTEIKEEPNLQQTEQAQAAESVLSDEVKNAMSDLGYFMTNYLGGWITVEFKQKEEGPNIMYVLFSKARDLLNSLKSMDKSNIPEKGDCGIV